MGSWIAVSENSRGHGKRSIISGAFGALLFALRGLPVLMAFAFAGAQAAPAVNALPQGGQVVAGQALISSNGARLDIKQTSPRAAIDWQSFNLGANASVDFKQPSSASVVLNRVLDAQPSQIFGRITSNGQVFLSNPAGIYFGPTASADVGALTATTHSISNADFMAGKTSFARNGAGGSVVNEGSLIAQLGGYIAMLAPHVLNDGVLIAKAGAIAMAAGEMIELKFIGERLTQLLVSKSSIDALVENRQAALAPDGLILLSAQAAQELQGGVIKQSGRLVADSMVSRGGRIVLEADHISLGADSQTLARGASGGGEVLVGGDWQGSNGVFQAQRVTMDAGALIDASATQQGDGGKVVLWSDVSKPESVTRAHGHIFAQGGAAGGNGGQVETSSHLLDTEGIRVNTQARQGRAGLWLLDPTNITIAAAGASGTAYSANYTAGTDSVILASDINASLNSGTSVTIATSAAGASTGNIAVNEHIAKTAGGDATLILKAHGDITIAANKSISSSTGKLNVLLNSDFDGNSSGTITMNSGSAISSNGGYVTLGGGTAGDGMGSAYGTATNGHGIYLNGSINSGAGKVTLTGTSNSGYVYSVRGVEFDSSASITTSSGDVSITGTGQSSTNRYGHGVRLGAWSKITTGLGNITILGYSSPLGQDSNGVVFNTTLGQLTTGGGNISVTGVSRANNAANDPNRGISGVYGASLVAGGSGTVTLIGTGGSTGDNSTGVVGVNISTAGGAVSIQGTSSSTGTGTYGVDLSSGSISTSGGAVSIQAASAAGTAGVNLGANTVNSSGGNITFTTNSYLGAGTETINAGAGTVTIQNRSVGTLIDVGGADVLSGSPLTLGVSNTELGRITAASTKVGSSSAGALTVSSDIATVSSVGSLYLQSGASVSGSGGIAASAGLTIDAASSGTLSGVIGGGALTKTGAGATTLIGTNTYTSTAVNGGTLQIGSGGSTGTLGSGAVSLANNANLSFVRAASTTIGNNISGSGNVSASITGASNTLTVSSPISLSGGTVALSADNDVAVSAAIATTNTSSAAVLLNAGQSTGAGSSSGGNLSFTGSGAVSVGTGGRATLMSGAIAGSTGLTALVGSGSGNFRYNSDEVSTNYSSALGSGIYAVYREQPSVSVASQAISYGDSPSSISSAGVVNGDPVSISVSSPLYSSSNSLRAGSYGFSISGLTPLGYNLGSNSGTLTVNPKGVTITGISAANKTYDGNTAATLNTTGASFSGKVAGDTLTVATATGSFADKNMGNAKTVSITGLSLSGSDAGNYVLDSSTASSSANIDAAHISAITGISAANKTYDGNTSATLNTTGASFSGKVAGDTLTVATSTGSFADKNAGNAKTVSITGLSLSGGDAGNYVLDSSTASSTANINAAHI
ncbi:YDG domain-containing protein, partial [Roseateles sp.]|uniref:YDG domain-containing protein n=1 Tax=Roseateles sp. TaxID=1971397 RepID=UPI003BA9A26F